MRRQSLGLDTEVTLKARSVLTGSLASDPTSRENSSQTLSYVRDEKHGHRLLASVLSLVKKDRQNTLDYAQHYHEVLGVLDGCWSACIGHERNLPRRYERNPLIDCIIAYTNTNIAFHSTPCVSGRAMGYFCASCAYLVDDKVKSYL